MPPSLTVAAIQMISSASLAENLGVARRLIHKAANAGAKVIALPEYFCLMGLKDTDKVAIRETFGSGPIQTAMQELTQQYQIHLIAGTIPLETRDRQKVLNTTLVFNPQGLCIARYDKMHLFGFQTEKERYQESETIEAGNQISTVRIHDQGNDWVFGLSICYDLRFPELYRQHEPVDCQVIPAAFTHTTGKDHWEILLRARAIENQCYFLASAQGGTHQNQRQTWGQSMLIDPWGQIMQELATGEGFVIGQIHQETLEGVRSKLPALKHRKLSS
jgi:nitrilase